MKTSKSRFYISVLVLIFSILTSCATNTKSHGKCKGLKAHPNYSKNWKKR